MRVLSCTNYPSDTRPAHQVFVRTFLAELARQGATITVVAPEPIANRLRRGAGRALAPRVEMRDGITVRRPRYVTFSNLAFPHGGRSRSLTFDSHVRAVARAAAGLEEHVDICYGHFLMPHGLAAATVAQARGVPAVLSLGESSFARYARASTPRERRALLGRFAAIVVNAEGLGRMCVDEYGVPEDRVHLLPNGVDHDVFHPLDRADARRRLGLAEHRPLVVFVGQLVERKGPLRLDAALAARAEIGVAFIGEGPQRPRGDNVVHCGGVPHDEIPLWLAAADVFALPTLGEGCCNAVLEALAAGVPVVTSDIPANRAIVPDGAAIFVDPRDTGALAEAITSILSDGRRAESLRRAGLAAAASYRVEARAAHVLALLREAAAAPGKDSGARRIA